MTLKRFLVFLLVLLATSCSGPSQAQEFTIDDCPQTLLPAFVENENLASFRHGAAVESDGSDYLFIIVHPDPEKQFWMGLTNAVVVEDNNPKTII